MTSLSFGNDVRLSRGRVRPTVGSSRCVRRLNWSLVMVNRNGGFCIECGLTDKNKHFIDWRRLLVGGGRLSLATMGVGR